MGRAKGQVTKAKGVPTNGWSNELKRGYSFKLTARAIRYLDKCKDTHNLSSRTDVLEALGETVILVNKEVFLSWLEEAGDKTSPRWQQAKKMLEAFKEDVPEDEPKQEF